MNVGELIEKLKKLDPSIEVAITSSNFEQNNAMKKAGGVRTFHGKVETRTFRDAFDYETYDSEIVTHSGSNEKHNFVEITEY